MLSDLLYRIRALFRRNAVEGELDEELRFHFDEQVEKHVRSGLSQVEAVRRARLTFGGIEQVKEECRDARGLRPLDDLRADLRYALRTLRSSPSFAFTAILTLALGIGANTGLFTCVDTLLLRPVAVRDPWSLYQLSGYTTTHHRFGEFSFRELQQVADGNRVFRQVFADSEVRALSPYGTLGGYLVSGNYFSALGVGTLFGRPIGPEDTMPSSHPVIVLGHAAWQRHFGGDAQTIGKTIELGGRPFTVIGVATSEFTGVDAQIPDFWAPLSTKAQFGSRGSAFDDPEERWLRIIGRLQPGITLMHAQVSMQVLLPQITESRPKDLRLVGARLTSRATYQSWDHADIANVLPILTAFALVLLIACTNLSNVLLARGLNRQREIGIRLALGASRSRIVRQLVTESVLLCLVAGVVGLLLSQWSLTLIRKLIVSSFSMKTAMAIVELTLDYRVFSFTLLVSLVTGIIFGLAPALHATRPSLTSALRAEGALPRAGIRPSRLRDVLIIAQFALSLVLLIGAGLLIRSAINFGNVSPRFDVAHAISVQTVQDTGSGDTAFQARISERLRRLPGVSLVAQALREPLRGSLPEASVSLEAGDSGQLKAWYNEVSPEYFNTLGVSLLRGRAFTRREAESESPVAVISAATAHRFWPGDDPLNKSIRITTERFSSGGREALLTTSRAVRVVGVANDVISGWLWDGVDPTCIYLPPSRDQAQYYSVLVRVAGNPKSMLPALRAVVSSTDPTVEFDVLTMEDVMDLQVLPFRVASWSAAALGALGLLLASIGIYGVMAYLVSQRTREIGIRMALGAERRDVLWMMLQEGGRLIAIAIGCGLVLAVGFSRILASMVFKIDATDPLTFVLAPLVLSVVGLFATYLPAHKATLVDPNVALHYD